MEQKQIIFSYVEVADSSVLNEVDEQLITAARQFANNAYAPYSHFNVAATALLNDGSIVSGTNQENASYPVGICAERTLLSTIANIAPYKKIQTIAISYSNEANGVSNIPATPCGMCRQALVEWQQRQGQSFRLLLSGQTGVVYIIEDAGSLLPLSFATSFLK